MSPACLPPPPCSPPTAVRLLDEFVQLAEGDTLVQNGATSNVGRVRAAACLRARWAAGLGGLALLPALLAGAERSHLRRRTGALPPAAPAPLPS